MEKTDIKFDYDRTKELYRKYYRFEKAKEFKKVPTVFLLFIGASVIAFGLYIEVIMLTVTGILFFSLVVLFLLYYHIRFELVFGKFLKELEKKSKLENNDFEFTFNEDLISYNSENISTQFKWDLIKTFQENGQDLYLYSADQQLIDIISDQFIGKEKLEKFKSILTSKVKI